MKYRKFYIEILASNLSEHGAIVVLLLSAEVSACVDVVRNVQSLDVHETRKSLLPY